MHSEKIGVLAHRGAMQHFPENTLLAFESAIEAGATAIELDVQLSQDLVPMVIHDSNLLRTSGIDKSVFSSTAAELSAISVHEPSRFAEQFYPCPLDTLQEVCRQLAKYKIVIFIELKTDSFALVSKSKMVELVLAASNVLANHRVLISFDHEVLQAVRAQSKLDIGWVIYRYNDAHHHIAQQLQPEYLICNQTKMPAHQPLWHGDWRWCAYDVLSPMDANRLLARGVTLLESADPLWLHTYLAEKKSHYDAIVIGAGIQGAAIALELVEQGKTCLVVEQYATAAAGTSSKSSKLIHGGLRYLETAQFALVFECLQAQKHWLRDYSDLVKPATFLIPLYRHSKRKSWQISLGLWCYSCLKGDWLGRTFTKIRAKDWPSHDKHLPIASNDLVAVFAYQDAQTDDQALTKRLCEQAQKFGAHCLFNAQVSRIALATKDQPHCQIELVNGERYSATTIINCAGPWAEQIAEICTPKPFSPPSELVQGVHIVINRQQAQCLYIESPIDGRAVFVLPYQSQVLIGTTERIYTGLASEQVPHEEDIQYLISSYNAIFADQPITKSDIVQAFSGLRVLPKGEVNANARRRDNIVVSEPNYLAVYGGKLTTSLIVAQKVVKKFFAR